MNRKLLAITAFVALAFVARLPGEAKAPRVSPEGFPGARLFCGQKIPHAAMDRFITLAGKDKANIVLIVYSKKADPDSVAKLTETWNKQSAASLTIIAGDVVNAKGKELLRKATGAWLLDCAPDVKYWTDIDALLRRDGVVGASGPGPVALWQVDSYRPSLGDGPQPAIPGLWIPVEIPAGATLQVRGRQMSVLGDATVTVRLRQSRTQPERTVEISAKSPADLTMLRRADLARFETLFHPKVAPVPEVPKGSLVIVGGGGLPADVTKKFIDLAGGPDALIVVLPTAQPDPLKPDAEAGFLRKAGCKNVVVIPGRKLEDVEDPKNLELVAKAGGVWFGGGRQWRFVDAYENTKMHKAFFAVLNRGGVIGGSSAGATIQGDYLCRGSPFNNSDIMCEGYERGLGFLPGVAIDQHFAQRKRFADMTLLMKTYPQLLGIGLDEATAIVVQGHTADVMGKGEAHFYDRRTPDKPDHESLKAGGRYDLKERKVLPSVP